MIARLSIAWRLLLVGLLLALTAGRSPLTRSARAASRDAAPRDTLVVAYPAATDTLDPALAYDTQDAAVLRALYEGLVRMKGTSTTQVEGVLATSWTANAQQTVWTFHLRQGVRFHDGTPFNAAAVKFSILRSMALNGGPSYIYAQYLDPSGIIILNPNTIQFRLKVPAPRLLYAMASQWGNWIVSPTAVKAHTVKKDMAQAWLSTHEAGTGPYMLSQYTPNSGATMVQFPLYWRGWGGPHVSRVIFSFVAEDATRRALLERGDADISNLFTPEDLTAMRANPALAVDTSSIVANWTLTPTVAGPLASAKARIALAYAFDYNGFINGLMKGYALPARGPLLHTVDEWDRNLPTFRTDLATARSLFAAAGVQPGTKLTVWYIREDETAKNVAIVAQGQLDQLGFDVRIIGRDGATFDNASFGTESASQRPNLWVGGWSGDYNDALAWFGPLYHTKVGAAGGGNMGLYHDAQADKLMDEAAVTIDPAKRRTLLYQVQQILTITDPAAVYVAEEKNSTTYRRGLHGYYYNPVYVLSYDLYAMWK